MKEGLVLLVIGMGTVFSFLILLVASMNLAAAFFKKYAHLFPEKQAAAPAPAANPLTEIAVAIAAVRAKRN